MSAERRGGSSLEFQFAVHFGGSTNHVAVGVRVRRAAAAAPGGGCGGLARSEDTFKRFVLSTGDACSLEGGVGVWPTPNDALRECGTLGRSAPP